MDVQATSEQLIKAIEIILNPSTPANQRNEANKCIEEFKDTSPICAECGFLLSSSSCPPSIRHLGLQLIDHYIKLHWNSISCEEKLKIKNNILHILSKDILMTEQSHVKDVLARIVVEIIKREWPQQWPSLLDELHGLCIMGDVQTELVLLIFLRLAEDIVKFQNVPDKRRREVYRALCIDLKVLFPFFLKTLADQCEKYFSHKLLSTPSAAAQNYCRISCVTLETLSVFIEWVPVCTIVEETQLFKQLCHLLNDDALQINAAGCLFSLVERRGKPEDRKPILKLFDENELFKIQSRTTQSLEQYHLFLKIYTQVVVTLGINLSHLLGQFSDVKEPENLATYLKCILSLTKHPSLVVSQHTHSIWALYLRDKKLSLNPVLQSLIPDVLKAEAEKLFKIGYLSKPNSKSSQYSLVEFDSDEDFEIAFHRSRSEVSEVLKLISKVEPELAFSYGCSMLEPLLNNQVPAMMLEIEDSNCLDIQSIWETVTWYFDALCITLMRNMDSPAVENLSKKGVDLLQQTLNFNSQDLYIMSYVLSCTSALFFFANFCSDALVPVFRRIFSNLIKYSSSEEKTPKDMLNLRRHSSSLLIRLSTTQPKLLLPIFDHLCQCVKELIETPDSLTALEKCSLLEALMILSNEFCSYDKQMKFLNEMVSPVVDRWFTDEIKMILSSTAHFVSYIGLNQSPDEINTFQKNRAQLLLLCNTIKACAKRCRIVTCQEVAEKGNFVHPISLNVNTFLCRNPSAQLLLPSLSGIFQLIRTIHSLYDPSVQAKIHPRYTKVLEISDTDKNNILGHAENNNVSKSVCERMKTFIHGLHDSCLHTLGDASENLMIDFYMIPNLSTYVNDCLFHCLHYLPDDKLRVIIKVFLKPLFYRCPVNLCGDLANILTAFCSFMFQKLSATWNTFKERYGTCVKFDEETTEIQEIFEDELKRLLTREYIMFLKALLQNKPVFDSKDSQMDDDSKLSSSNHVTDLSELGLKVFHIEQLRTIIISTAFGGLLWLDSVANIHCIELCELLFNQLLKDGLIHQEQEANYLLQTALHGLHELGEHETNQGLLVSFAMHVYEKLRPRFPSLRESLISSVHCDINCIERLEKLMFRDEGKKAVVEKQKKDAFRTVVKNVIGKNIGQYHKQNIVIKNLPPLFIVPKEQKTDVINSSTSANGLCNLFVSP